MTKMHLVDDEVIPVRACGKDVQVRLRIWRARDTVPVVLMSRPSGSPSWPCRMSTRAADIAYGAILGFPPGGMHYYETEGGSFWRVSFGFQGRDTTRLRHADPRRRLASAREVEDLIGGQIPEDE